MEFTGCDLASLHWSDSRLSSVVFRDCKLMGATLVDVALDNVLFENCTLDYCTFIRVRATGPVIVTGCSLCETTFDAADLSAVLFDDCDLRQVVFDGGKHRGLDLRGNNLSQLRGLASLTQLIIDRAQTSSYASGCRTSIRTTWRAASKPPPASTPSTAAGPAQPNAGLPANRRSGYPSELRFALKHAEATRSAR